MNKSLPREKIDFSFAVIVCLSLLVIFLFLMQSPCEVDRLSTLKASLKKEGLSPRKGVHYIVNAETQTITIINKQKRRY